MIKKYKGAIFDMDGTLLESMHIWQQLVPDFLKSNNLAMSENLAELLAGANMRQAVELLIDWFDLPMECSRLYLFFMDKLTDYYQYEVKLKPGAERFLQDLYSRKVQCMLFTSSPEKLARLALERLNTEKYFSCGILSCESMNCSKAQSQAFLTASERMALDPSEIIVFEDALYAAKSAKAADFTVAAMADFSETQSDELRQIADFYIEKSFDEFPIEQFF